MDVYLTGLHRSPAYSLCNYLHGLKPAIGVTSAWHHYPSRETYVPRARELAEMMKHEPTHYAVADAVVWVGGEGEADNQLWGPLIVAAMEKWRSLGRQPKLAGCVGGGGGEVGRVGRCGEVASTR